MRSHSHKSTEAHRIVKDALLAGRSIYEAMLRAGYSEKQARKGRAALPSAVFALMTREELWAYRSMGRSVLSDREQLEDAIVGFLFCQMTANRERGIRAAELLGKHTGILRLTEEQHMQDKSLFIEKPL